MWHYNIDKAMQDHLPAEWRAQIFMYPVPRRDIIECHLFTTQENGQRYRTDYQMVAGEGKALSTISIYSLTEDDCVNIAKVGKTITEAGPNNV